MLATSIIVNSCNAVIARKGLRERDIPGGHPATELTAIRKAFITKPRNNFLDLPYERIIVIRLA